jgi:hypothetical protein
VIIEKSQHGSQVTASSVERETLCELMYSQGNRLRTEKLPVGGSIHGKLRIQSERGLLPDSSELSTSTTRAGYLVGFPLLL